jgi:hypothetical protein
MIFVQDPQTNNTILNNLPHIVTAIGGLGTAAFGLVDAIKPLVGVNQIGFTRISDAVKKLTPGESAVPQANANAGDAPPAAVATGLAANALPQAKILDSLKANWYNGTDLSSQKSIAKSLIKMGLTAGNSGDLAAATGVNAELLKSVATKIANGAQLEPNESDIFARFDFSLTALLDELYQHADQVYRNWTRFLAAFFAVGLAFIGGWTLDDGTFLHYLTSNNLWLALVAGVLATPLAPIAKDISSALSTAVNTMQAIKK